MGAPYTNGSRAPASTTTLTGQYVARAHLTRKQRARLAADLSTGAAVIVPVTVKQAAMLVRVPVLDVSQARRNGKHGNGRSNGHEETLAEHIARSSPTERLAAARIIGVGELWDSMISPVVSDERTATEANSTA
jgi:hypothetical protein